MNKEVAVRISFLLLRVVVGFLFFQVGAMKLLGWFGGMPPGMAVAPFSQIWIGGVLETVGGILIATGLFVRPVAFILSGEMAVAYWQFHAPRGTWPHQNQGQAAVLFCFLFLFFAAYGAGELSLDAVLRKRRAGASPAGSSV
jgi:putative oxidoreductase